MMETYALLLLVAYGVGGIPFGYLIARYKGIDVRAIGSGNIGATNVGRALGIQYFLLTLLLDGLKGWAPTWVARGTFDLSLAIPIALASMIGHSFSPYLGFRGGKGVATGAGAALALIPGGVLTALIVWGGALALVRIMSVASLSGTAAFTAYVWLWEPNLPLRIFALLALVLIVYRFRDNIRRLIRGEEPRIVFGQYRQAFRAQRQEPR